MDENQMDENRIGRKALDQNPLDENWAHDKYYPLWLRGQGV